MALAGLFLTAWRGNLDSQQICSVLEARREGREGFREVEMEARWRIGCEHARTAERSPSAGTLLAKAAKVLFAAMIALAGVPVVVLAMPDSSGWTREEPEAGKSVTVGSPGSSGTVGPS